LTWPKRSKSAPEDVALDADEVTEVSTTEAPSTDEAETETDTAADSTGDTTDETSAEPTEGTVGEDEPAAEWRVDWSRVVAFGVLPAIALLLAAAAGFFKWQDNSVRNTDIARIESVQTAKDSTIAMLSYKPDTVEQQLQSARDLLTGEFRDSYTSLITDVVIPGAKQQQISAEASIPAAASVSADPREAVVLVFVNQTTIIGKSAPTDTASTVRVTLNKAGDRWLISKFEPV
jgi:Mce-associated membrane protein